MTETLVEVAHLPQRVCDFLARGLGPEQVQEVRTHTQTVTALARSYTRRRGFTDYAVEEPLAAVITTATARSWTNPVQEVRREVGSISTVYTPFLGWSLVELSVLNDYRRTSA